MFDKIKLGILVYEKDTNGDCINIGDYIQSLSQINLYRQLLADFYNEKIPFEIFFNCILNNRKFKDFNFTFVKRDKLSETTETTFLILNGWFMHSSNGIIDWPPPKNIIPLFISFHIFSKQIVNHQNIEYLKKHEPIGCRDEYTHDLLSKLGVSTYLSGCCSLTIDFLKWDGKQCSDKTLNVDVEVDKEINCDFMQQWFCGCKNLTHEDLFRLSLKILKKYTEYKKVNTNRLHTYLPCVAMNVPVTFIDLDKSVYIGHRPLNRFGGLINKNQKIYENYKKIIISKLKLKFDELF